MSNSATINTAATTRRLPKRIILVRHGESEGNKDESILERIPNHKLTLSDDGKRQARDAGELIRDVISDKGSVANWKTYFYVSPYQRTRETLHEMGPAFPENKVVGVREECTLREQDFGNFQDPAKMKELKKIRDRYGRFFYRFPEGESAADVYDRISSFLESFWRDIDMNRIHYAATDDLNIIIVTHGLTMRAFLMRWFKWTAEQFDNLRSPKNCEFRVLQLGHGAEYSLTFQHDDEQLKAWGLSDEMIEDQKIRAYGPKVGIEKAFFSTFVARLAVADDSAHQIDDKSN